MGNKMKVALEYVVKNKPISALNKALGKTKKSNNAVERSAKGAFRAQSKGAEMATRGVSGLTKKVLGLGAAYFGFKAIKDFYRDSIELSKEQTRVETNLFAVMQNNRKLLGDPTAIKSGVEMLKAYASEVQNIGVIGDEVIISGQQQLATFQLLPSSIRTLSMGLGDLVAQQRGLEASTGDAMGIANLLGKVMEGQVGALSRVGISFSDAQKKILKFGTEEEKAAALAQVLKDNVGGVNAALRQTDPGKIQAANNSFGDMQEVVGKELLPAIVAMKMELMENLPAIQKLIISVTKSLVFLTDKGLAFVSFLTSGTVASKIFIATLMGIAGVVALYKTWIAVQTALNVVMALNPIGLIVLGIAGLIAGISLLIIHWDTVKAKMIEVWETINANPFLKLLTYLNPVTLAIRSIIVGFKTISKVMQFLGGTNGTAEIVEEVRVKAETADIDGSHRSGLSRVPKDGYIAELHKGERVLTSQENNNYSSGGNNYDITVNTNNSDYNNSLSDFIQTAIEGFNERYQEQQLIKLGLEGAKS